MRAEAHYVDFLESRTLEARERALAIPPVDAPAYSDQRSETPPVTRQSSPPAPTNVAPRLDRADTTLHAGRDLTQSLATLSACVDLLTTAPSDLSRAVAANLIRAEVWRASVLLHATRVLRQELAVVRTATAVLGILDRVQQGFLPERRVRTIAIETQSDVPYGSIMAGDAWMLTGAISCGVLATLALLESVQDARVLITAGMEPGRQITFAVSQDAVTPPGIWHARAFDPQWTDRTGGIPALVSMLAIQRTAEAHGGSVSVEPAGRGTRIALTIPVGV